KSLLKEHKLDISKHDKVSHNLNTEIKDGLVINIDKAYKIPVNYAGEEESVWTTGGTVGEILSENDVKIKKSDKVNPAKKEQETDEHITNISKDYKIPVNDEGEEESVWTTGGTVGKILSEKDFKIKKSDKVNPAKKEQVTKNTEIEVTKVTKDTIVEKEST